MRRPAPFAILLAFLLLLPACGDETSGGDPPVQPAEDEDVTLCDCGGLQAALPSKYIGKLRVETEFPDAEENWKPLISVYEKASYEAAMEEYGGGGGFLFGFLMMDQAAFEQHISAGGSGIDVFATDGERYFAYTYPTDVQFCRPGGEIDTESPDWREWEELNTIGPVVREDFLERNGLQSFSTQDFIERPEDGDHVCVRYYPYYAPDGDTRVYYQLLLRQPARQGEGGIWAVDQWLDEFGNQYLYFPDSGKPAAEYYAQLQEKCDTGEHPGYLTPAGAAMIFAWDCFGHEATQGSVCEEAEGVDHGYMERNRKLDDMVRDIQYDCDVDDMALLECLSEADADNWGVLGRYNYGSDWFTPLMEAVADAAVGTDQQARDKAVMAFFLATQDTDTDFRTPLSAVLQSQEQAEPGIFAAALSDFPEEERGLLSMYSGLVRSHPPIIPGPSVDVDVPTY